MAVLKGEKKRVAASDLAIKALSDTTKYDSMDVALGVTENLDKQFREAIENYRDKIDQEEFCVVMLIGRDNLLPNVIRRKFYCWPYLPKPRPNQTVLLYNKPLDRITKRLWVLPCDAVMAELASMYTVDERYATMQRWSKSFFNGTFWEDIRKEHGIKMLSQFETDFLEHRNKKIEPFLNEDGVSFSDTFDFEKALSYDLGYTGNSCVSEDRVASLGKHKGFDGNVSSELNE